MLHYETIHPDTLELLRKIQSLEMFSETRLVGGTSLALQLGHRKSVDLDFFGKVEATLEEITAELSTALVNLITIKKNKELCFSLT